MDTNIQAAKQIDLLDLIGKTTTLRKVAAHEWSGACPKCGGKDRFRVDPTKGFFCRQCQGDAHWNDAIDFIMWYEGLDFKRALLRLVGRNDITPAEIERRAVERKQRDDQRQREEAAKRAEITAKLSQSEDWKTYNKHPKAIEEWAKRGLAEDWVRYYGLGYCPERTFFCGDTPFQSDSLTIPYWRSDFSADGSMSWRIVNLKHRLLHPQDPGDKYRPHLSGAGNQLFYTDPMTRHLFGDVLIVEGEIKAMVTWAALWSTDNVNDAEIIAPGVFVVGLPGKSWKGEWVTEFEKCDRVYICLDPDAGKDAERLAQAIGSKSRIIRLPEKIDDMINMKALDGIDLIGILDGQAGVLYG